MVMLVGLSFIPGVNLVLYTIVFTVTILLARVQLNRSESNEVLKTEQRVIKLADKYTDLLAVEGILKEVKI
jgi:hypothetical protein